MNNLIKRSNDIAHGVGRYNGIKKRCRMGNTMITDLDLVTERVSFRAELNFEIFSLNSINIYMRS